MIWENTPSTNSPINAENLNSMNNSASASAEISSVNLMGIDVQENLYPGSADFGGTWLTVNATITNPDTFFKGYPIRYVASTWARYYREIYLTAGTYTFEGWFKADNASSIFVYLKFSSTTNPATLSQNSFQFNNKFENNKWSKVSVTFDVTAAGNVSPFILTAYGSGMYISQYRLVKGTSVFSLSDALDKKTDKSDFDVVEEKTNAIVTNKNYLEDLEVTELKAYERTTANVLDNQYCNIYPAIEIKSGKKYYYRNLYAYVCVVKYADNTSLNLSNDSTVVAANGSFTASANGYIYISVRRGQSNFVFTDSKDLYNSGLTDTFYTIDVQNLPKEYTVRKDGTGDFDSLVDAIEEATKYMDSIVRVGSGVWDLIDELGEDYIDNVSQTQRGVYLKNRIHLIFESGASVECIYTGERADTIAWLSAFNAGENGFTLENAKIITENIRYSVHDERDQDTDFYTNHYKNCEMIHSSTYAQGGQNQCIGGGLGLNGHIIIEGCVFENPLRTTATAIVSYHNSAGSGKSFLEVKGNYVRGTNTMRFNYYGASTEKSIVLCHDNSVGYEIRSNPETQSSTNVNIELIQWNNEIRS